MRMAVSEQSQLLRNLPSVDELLRGAELMALAASQGRAAVADAVRAVLDDLREEIVAAPLDEKSLEIAISGIPVAVEKQLREAQRPSLRAVVNATGVILHTNLGRAPLGGATLERVREIGSGYSNLEFDLTTGRRGQRDTHADRLFASLLAQQLGGKASRLLTAVVNNNAAAVLLALNTLAEGGEAVVSRGELVEISGSFRIPEVMAKAGVTLREVGTTNRTRIGDYHRAITKHTRVLLRVHRSNFEMRGFTEQPELRELVALGRKRKIPVMEDLGSGALFDLRSIGVNSEPDVAASLRAGVDVVTYSGDKLLGGPQAGVLTGKKQLIGRIRQNPLFRALRVDKLTYAALESTLLAYLRGDAAGVPVLRMMHMSKQEVGRRASALQQALLDNAELETKLIEGESVIGGGAAPGAALPSLLLALRHRRMNAQELAAELRKSEPQPIIARVEEGSVLLDLRTVFEEQDHYLGERLLRLGSREGKPA